MAARKAKPESEKVSQHLTVNLTPDEMLLLKMYAEDTGRSVNGLVKWIVTREIERHKESKKAFLMVFEWPQQRPLEVDHRHTTSILEVRRITSEEIAKGATRITVLKKNVSGVIYVFDAWVPGVGWAEGRVEPKESK